MTHVPDLLLWLFVINHGIACGAGFYEQRIVLPQWFSRAAAGGIRVNAAAMRATDPGRRFWSVVTTIPLTGVTLANLAVAWGSGGARHEWWLGAVLVTLVERIATFSYFIPTAIRLMRAEELAPEKASAMAHRWLALNHLRALLGVIGWLAALRALSLPG